MLMYLYTPVYFFHTDGIALHISDSVFKVSTRMFFQVDQRLFNLKVQELSPEGQKSLSVWFIAL